MQLEADISKCIATQEDDPPEMLGSLPKMPSKSNSKIITINVKTKTNFTI